MQVSRVKNVSLLFFISGFGAGNCHPKSVTTSPPKISQYYETYMMEMGYDAHLKCVTVGRHSTTWMGKLLFSFKLSSFKILKWHKGLLGPMKVQKWLIEESLKLAN